MGKFLKRICDLDVQRKLKMAPFCEVVFNIDDSDSQLKKKFGKLSKVTISNARFQKRNNDVNFMNCQGYEDTKLNKASEISKICSSEIK